MDNFDKNMFTDVFRDVELQQDESLEDAEVNVCPYVDRRCHRDCASLRYADGGWYCMRQAREVIQTELMRLTLAKLKKELENGY